MTRLPIDVIYFLLANARPSNKRVPVPILIARARLRDPLIPFLREAVPF